MKKLRATFCALFGHSHIIDPCFGYQHCARCTALLGDTLAGVGAGPNYVPRDHVKEDPTCTKCNIRWHDRFFLVRP